MNLYNGVMTDAHFRSSKPKFSARPTREHTFSVVLSEAIATKGVTLTWLRERLSESGHRISLGTLSYWRSGARVPEHPNSLDVVSELETLLAMPPGRLRGTLGPPRRPGPPSTSIPYTELANLPSSAEELIDELGFRVAERSLDQMTIHVAVDVDKLGNDTMMTTRLTLRALRDGVDRYPIGLIGLEGGDRADVAWVRGGTVESELLDREFGVQAWQICLEHPLTRGQTVAVEYALRLPSTSHNFCEYYVGRRVKELLLWVNFDPDHLPESAQAYDSAAAPDTYPLQVSASLTVVLHSYGPGTAGIRWIWPE